MEMIKTALLLSLKVPENLKVSGKLLTNSLTDWILFSCPVLRPVAMQ